MTITSEKRFLQALELCHLLVQDLAKPSVLPCQAITLLCEVAAKPEDLLKYNQKYGSIALMQVKNYTHTSRRVLARLPKSLDIKPNLEVKKVKCSQKYFQKHLSTLNLLKSLSKVSSSGKVQHLIIDETDNQSEISKALNVIDQYARSADNWRVIGENCNLGFGVRDHCSILDFLLKFPSSNFVNFTGNFESAELICEILQDWRGINLLPWLASSPQLLTS